MSPGPRPLASLSLLPALAALLLLSGPVPAATQEAGQAASDASDGTSAAPPAGERTVTENGVRVRMELVPEDAPDAGRRVREKEHVRLEVELTDADTGEPLEGEKPAAWIDRRQADWAVPEDACQQRINGYLPKKMRTRPVVDLNSYVVLTLNRGNHISVLDPFFGFGSTNMLDAVKLPAEGRDWTAGPQGRFVYVTLPRLNQVVRVRTGTWEVQDTASVGTSPGRIRWGADRERLWVAVDEGEKSGISSLDPSTLNVTGHVATGGGRHEIAVRPDGRLLYVTNPGDGTVSVVDPSVPEVTATLKPPGHPVDLEYSAYSDRLYVVDDRDGRVMVYDGETLEPTTRITGSSGLWRIDFDPSGRWGFLLNRRTDEVHVLDAAVDEVKHGVVSEGKPDQVHFTEDFAFVRSQRSSQVMMIGLRSLQPGAEGSTFADDFRGEGDVVRTETGIAAVHFPAGDRSPADTGDPGIGPAMALAPHKPNAIYVTNPPEKSVYFYRYQEGMPTPAGNLKTYEFEPKSALTVGRDLKKDAPGVYSATFSLESAGDYSVNMVVDEPRVVHCFPFDVRQDPGLATDERSLALELEAVSDLEIRPGRESTVAFRLRDTNAEEVVTDVDEVVVRLTSPRGWQKTLPAGKRDDGSFAVPVTVPDPGVYYLSARIPQLNKGFEDQHYLVLRAVEGEATGEDGRSPEP